MTFIAIITTIFLFPSPHGQTASDLSHDQNPGQKILTADDFKNRMITRGAELEEETFWLQVNKKLPPYKFRLIPDAAVKDNSGANNPPHRVGRIEISTEKSPTPIQTIEVSAHAGVSNFRSSFTVIDINLDGYLDIAVLDEFGAKWGRQNYWLFDKRSGRYVTNSLTKELYRITHNGIVPHPETKEIEVAHFPALIPRPGKVNERYKIVNGHLVLTRKEEIRSTSKGLRVFTRKRVNGKMKTIGVKEVSEIAPQQNSSAAIQK